MGYKVIATLTLAGLLCAVAAAPGKAGEITGEDVIHLIIEENRADLEEVYRAAFGDSGAGSGLLTFAVTINAEGKIEGIATTEDTIGDEEFEDAVREEVRGWEFTPSLWGKTWYIELDFNPAAGIYGVEP